MDHSVSIMYKKLDKDAYISHSDYTIKVFHISTDTSLSTKDTSIPNTTNTIYSTKLILTIPNDYYIELYSTEGSVGNPYVEGVSNDHMFSSNNHSLTSVKYHLHKRIKHTVVKEIDDFTDLDSTNGKNIPYEKIKVDIVPKKSDIKNSDLIGRVLSCHTTYHRGPYFYVIIRETSLYVFVRKATEISKTTHSDGLSHVEMIYGFTGYENNEYKLLKRVDNDGTQYFRGKADHDSPQTFYEWNGKPTERNTYY